MPTLTALQPRPERPAPRTDDDGNLGPRRLFDLLWKYKWLISTLVLISSVGTWSWTRTLPSLYQADCTIEYDRDPTRPLGKDYDAATFVRGGQEFYATQLKVMRSRALSERVVRKLGLQHNADYMGIAPQDRASFRGGDVTAAAQMLQNRVARSPLARTVVRPCKVADIRPNTSCGATMRVPSFRIASSVLAL
jgi:hypothetical protein